MTSPPAATSARIAAISARSRAPSAAMLCSISPMASPAVTAPRWTSAATSSLGVLSPQVVSTKAGLSSELAM